MRVLVVDPGGTLCGLHGGAEWNLDVTFCRALPGAVSCDLLVLPAVDWLCRPSPPTPGMPVYVYGPSDLLADSFAAGCTDYLREPWGMDELQARALRFWTIRFRLGTDELSYSTGCLEGPGGSVLVSEAERIILELLLGRLGRAVPREAFARACGSRRDARSRSSDMAVSRLRCRLSSASGSPLAGAFLVPVRNYGYRLDGKSCG
ncbi:MAG TPA: winged helix-turn-helix domain-containing protein [Magnetospirillaceae bacterium]|nr:winged helix-turn-helix domain-containing protein [Magnetospirillaceae bacterium]